MGNPTQGAWTCRHGVDGRDHCDECFSPPPAETVAPLRRIVSRSDNGYSIRETLECGHIVTASWSLDAKRRRCAECLVPPCGHHGDDLLDAAASLGELSHPTQDRAGGTTQYDGEVVAKGRLVLDPEHGLSAHFGDGSEVRDG